MAGKVPKRASKPSTTRKTPGHSKGEKLTHADQPAPALTWRADLEDSVRRVRAGHVDRAKLQAIAREASKEFGHSDNAIDVIVKRLGEVWSSVGGHGKRYHTRRELCAAVRAQCIAAVDWHMGGAGESAKAEAILLAYVEIDKRSRNVWRKLMGALHDAQDLMRELPEQAPTMLDHAVPSYANELRRFIGHCDFDQRCQVDHARKAFNQAGVRPSLRAERPDLESFERRGQLIVMLIQSSSFWWHERPPTTRELAVLTLLAEEFPPTMLARLGPDGVGPTVAEVIEAEEKLIGAAIAGKKLRGLPQQIESMYAQIAAREREQIPR